VASEEEEMKIETDVSIGVMKDKESPNGTN